MQEPEAGGGNPPRAQRQARLQTGHQKRGRHWCCGTKQAVAVSLGVQAPRHGQEHHQKDIHRRKPARVPNPLGDQDHGRKDPLL